MNNLTAYDKTCDNALRNSTADDKECQIELDLVKKKRAVCMTEWIKTTWADVEENLTESRRIATNVHACSYAPGRSLTSVSDSREKLLRTVITLTSGDVTTASWAGSVWRKLFVRSLVRFTCRPGPKVNLPFSYLKKKKSSCRLRRLHFFLSFWKYNDFTCQRKKKSWRKRRYEEEEKFSYLKERYIN